MAVKSRRKARETAVQVLYSIEVGHVHPDWALEDGLKAAELRPDQEAFTRRLVEGIYDDRYSIDQRLGVLLEEWDLWRLAAVDRSVLRVAAFELLHCPGIPPLVTINEAIEIAKKFSTAESGKFVNGVLARLMAESSKANWDPSQLEVPPEDEEPPEEEPEPEPETLEVDESSDEVAELAKVGLWKIRAKQEGEDGGNDS